MFSVKPHRHIPLNFIFNFHHLFFLFYDLKQFLLTSFSVLINFNLIFVFRQHSQTHSSQPHLQLSPFLNLFVWLNDFRLMSFSEIINFNLPSVFHQPSQTHSSQPHLQLSSLLLPFLWPQTLLINFHFCTHKLHPFRFRHHSQTHSSQPHLQLSPFLNLFFYDLKHSQLPSFSILINFNLPSLFHQPSQARSSQPHFQLSSFLNLKHSINLLLCTHKLQPSLHLQFNFAQALD